MTLVAITAAAAAATISMLGRRTRSSRAIPSSPFFLLALPDHFYLWCRLPSLLAVAPPDYDIDPAPLLAPYVADGGRSLRTMSEGGLTLAVSSWLTDLVASDLDAETAGSHHAWLFESGLYRAIAGGVIRPQAVL